MYVCTWNQIKPDKIKSTTLRAKWYTQRQCEFISNTKQTEKEKRIVEIDTSNSILSVHPTAFQRI